MVQLFDNYTRISRPVDLDVYCLHLGFGKVQSEYFKDQYQRHMNDELSAEELVINFKKHLKGYWWFLEDDNLAGIKKTLWFRFLKLIRVYKPTNN